MTGDDESQKPQGRRNLLPGFGGLEGIDNPRDVQARNPTILDKLVDCGDNLVSKHSKEMPDTDALDGIELMDGFYSMIYNEVMQTLAPFEVMHGVSFDERDIKEFLIARANTDLARPEAQVLGIYSGVLAQILTERNALQGKRTVIHLDGCMDLDGNMNNNSTGSNNKSVDNPDLCNRLKFDYLFYFARVLDTVILENFDGEEILAYAGTFGGRADTLVSSRINGSCCLMGVGSYRGRVNKPIAINIDGTATLMGSGSNNGYASQVIGINIKKGDANLSSCASNYGFIEQLIGVGITNGSDNLAECCSIIGCTDVINQIFAIDVNGSGTLRTIGNDKSRINEIIYDGIVGTNFSEYPTPNAINCKELIDGEQVRATHSLHGKNSYDAERIETTIALIRSLKDKPYQEVIQIADQIYALRPVFPFEYFKGVGK